MMGNNAGQDIQRAIEDAEHVLLHLHPRPDPDSIGSVLATMHVLRAQGKEVTVMAGDSLLPKEFSMLPGFNTIVEQTYGETDLSAIDLFIILDSANIEQITAKEEVAFPAHLTTVVIDHHTSNPGFGDINLVEKEAAATAQILYELFESWEVEITPEIAVNLMVGIYYDTVFFTTPLTTPRSAEIFGLLARYAPDFHEALSAFQNNQPKDRVLLTALLAATAKDYCGGSIGIAALSYSEIEKRGLNPQNTGKVHASGMLKSVAEWDIVATLLEEEPEKIKLSLRTLQEDRYNLSRVAEKLDGGGHPGAAGAVIHASLKEARDKLLRILKETFPSLVS